MPLFRRKSSEPITQIDQKAPDEYDAHWTPEEKAFWASFVNEFVVSDEWIRTMKQLIEYWRGIDSNVYPIYLPLQELQDWELALGTEIWIIYDFATTYAEYGLVDGIDPSLSSETRIFLSEYFAALARKMSESDITGLVSVVKNQIEVFGEADARSEGSASKFA